MARFYVLHRCVQKCDLRLHISIARRTNENAAAEQYPVSSVLERRLDGMDGWLEASPPQLKSFAKSTIVVE